MTMQRMFLEGISRRVTDIFVSKSRRPRLDQAGQQIAAGNHLSWPASVALPIERAAWYKRGRRLFDTKMSVTRREMPSKNILCIVIDRLHVGFVGAYGNTWISTPH